MISYKRLWQKCEEKGITKYRLTEYYHMSRSLVWKLSHDMPVSANTLDRLCNILECRIEEICEHIPDDNVF